MLLRVGSNLLSPLVEAAGLSCWEAKLYNPIYSIIHTHIVLQRVGKAERLKS